MIFSRYSINDNSCNFLFQNKNLHCLSTVRKLDNWTSNWKCFWKIWKWKCTFILESSISGTNIFMNFQTRFQSNISMAKRGRCVHLENCHYRTPPDGWFTAWLDFCVSQVEESSLTLHTADYFALQRISLGQDKPPGGKPPNLSNPSMLNIHKLRIIPTSGYTDPWSCWYIRLNYLIYIHNYL